MVKNPIVRKYLQDKYQGGGAPTEEAMPPVPQWPTEEEEIAAREPAAAAPVMEQAPRTMSSLQGQNSEGYESPIMELVQQQRQQVADAQERADRGNFGANIGRGVDTMIAGLGNTKPQGDFYSDMVAQNQKGVDNVKDVGRNLLEAERLNQGTYRIGQSDARLGHAVEGIGLRKRGVENAERRTGMQLDETGHKHEKEGREREVPGYGLAPSKELAQKLIEASKEANEGVDAVDKLLTLSANPRNKFNPEARASAKIYVASLKAGARIAVTGGGNISEYEQKLLDQIAADPTSIFSMPAQDRASLKAMKEKFVSGMRGYANAMGVTEDDRVQARGASLNQVKAGAAKDNEKVLIIDTDGISKKIPRSRLNEALKDGARLPK